MSARAAARLETLGFTRVYRYQPGRADWFAAGLPREGRDAHTRRVADIADRNVATCSVLSRARRSTATRTDVSKTLVTTSDGVLIGLLRL